MTIQAGYNKTAVFISDAGQTDALGLPVPSSASVIVAVTGFSWKEMIDALDVSSTSTQQIQALIAGIFRGEGNVKGFVDNASFWWVSQGIRAGVNGTLSLRVGTVGQVVVIPCMITQVNVQVEHAGTVQCDFDVRLNALANTGVALVRPS